jgi:hypothetical protein
MPQPKSVRRWRQGVPGDLLIAKSAEAENPGTTQHKPTQRAQSARNAARRESGPAI